jgi:hypothetical protein
MNIKYSSALLLSSALLVACGSDNKSSGGNGSDDSQNFIQACLAQPSQATEANIPCDGGTTSSIDVAGEPITVPAVYAFTTQIDDDSACAVSYTGQTARNVAISDMKALVACDELATASSEDVAQQLSVAFAGIANAEGDVNFDILQHNQVIKGGLATVPGPSYADISGDKSLVGKIAGNDGCTGVNAQLLGQTEGVDTALNSAFVAASCEVSDTAKGSAQQLVEHYIAQVANLAEEPQTITTAAGVEELNHYVDAEGRDYQQLMQKFLSVAVAFNQGTNDYLATIFDKEGIHTGDKEGTKPYSSAEHKWDEGFGYFGAARDYTSYTDVEISDGDVNDTNGDTYADLRSEVNMNHSVNCAKRDKGLIGKVDPSEYTEYTDQAFTAFVEGRAILSRLAKAEADGELATLEADLVAALDSRIETASVTWEKCIAATAVHYINDSIGDIDATASGQFEDVAAFKTYAKHWSELKGFALGLQYNRRSPMYANDNANLALYTDAMALIADKPVVSGEAELSAYKTNLESARAKLAQLYSFTADQAANW